MIAPEQTDTSQTAARRSILAVWIDVIASLSGLVQAEGRLIRVETAANFEGAGRSVLLLAAGGLLLLVTLVFLAVAGVMALATVVGMVWALLLVALGCLVAGGLLIGVARRRLDQQSFLPERSLARMAADLQRLADRIDAPPPPYGDKDGTATDE